MGGSGGDWNNVLNWNPGTVPGSFNEDVVNHTANAINHNSGTHTINSLVIDGGAALNLLGGSLLASVPGTSVLNTNGQITMSGSATLSGFVVSAAGGVVNNGIAYLSGLTFSAGTAFTGSGGSQTYVSGTIDDQGSMQVNGGGGFNTYLYTNGSATLQGGGALTLNTTAAGGGNAYVWLSGGNTLTNLNHTIQGDGIIYNNGATVVNGAGGVVNANSTGSPQIAALTLEYGNVTNSGLLEASNSGTLQLYQNAIDNAGGNITANGANATVQVYNSTVQGGTLNSLSGGLLETIGTSVLDGSTASGAMNVSSGSTYLTAAGNGTYALGTINNQGNFQVNGGGGYNSTLYAGNGAAPNTTLQGGGTVTLSTAAAGGGNAYLYQGGGSTLTNVDNTIQGEGIIYNNGATLVNQSTINANSTGGALINVLAVEYGSITNTALLEATNSGVLQLYSNTINNAGGNIKADGANATVQIYDSTVQGGTLSNNGGTMQTIGTSFLDASTNGAMILNGTYLTTNGANTLVQGTYNNHGTFQVNGGGGYNTYLTATGNTTLQGGGVVALNTTAAGGGNAYLYLNGGVALTNLDNTIQGEGIIYCNGATLTNHSLINANSAGGPLISALELDYGTITNTALMEATNSGLLRLYSNTINNSGADITANGAGTTVDIYNTTIQGGTLNNNGGTLETIGSAILDGSTHGALTLNGTYTTSSGRSTTLPGTINNQGGFQVNGGGGVNTYLYTGATTTLQGGGMVTLNTTTTGGAGEAWLYLNGGNTLNNVNNTIQGEGVIYCNGAILNNQATINANSTGGALASTLAIEYGTVNNTALLEATNNGVLQLLSNTINNAGGNITANGAGATVDVANGTVIQGGTVSNNGGTLETISSATLDGNTQGTLTLNGNYTTSSGRSTTILGTINNHGNLQVNGGGGVNTYLYPGSGAVNNTILQGGGMVTLNTTTTGGGGGAWLYLNGGYTLNNVDNTIQGEGIVYANGATLVNGAGGTILANSTGAPLTSTLQIEYGTVTNNGTFQANNGATLALTGANLTNFDGGAKTLNGGTYLVSGTLQFDNADIQTNNAKVVLDGPASAIVDQFAVDGLRHFSANAAGGDFTIQNGRNLTTPGDLSNAGLMTVGNGSTLKIGAGGSNAYTQVSGTTQGIGAIAGNVAINGGSIMPGLPNTPGTLTVNGSFTQSGGTFDELIDGSGNGLLHITGASLLNPGVNLNIDLLNGFTPTVGQTFTIMDFASGSGVFANAPGSGFVMDNFNWTIAYNGGDIVLNALGPVLSYMTATWQTPAGDGNWTTASQWDIAAVPNNVGVDRYAVVLDNAGHTLTLDGASTPTSVTVESLQLKAGTLNIGTGATLNLANQPGGLTDIGLNAGLTLAGTFEVGGSGSALANLASVEGTLTLAGQTTTATPGGGTFVNSGNLNVQQTSSLKIVGNLNNSGAVSTGNGVADTGSNSVTVTGTLTNSGSITLRAAGDSLTADLTNSGSISLNGDNQTLTDTGDFINNNGGALTLNANAGTVTVAGNLSNAIGATVKMHGSNGSAAVSGTVQNSGGSVALDGSNNTLSAQAGFANDGGNVAIGATNSLKSLTDYTQTSGTTTVDGTLQAQNVRIKGGTLTGSGTVVGALDNLGAVNPGDGVGKLTVNGLFTQEASGLLNVDILGSTPASLYDQLIVADAAALDGTLNILLGGGYLPTDGQTFTIMDFASFTGSFSTVNGLSFGSGGSFSVEYNPTNVELVAHVQGGGPGPGEVPEPSSVAIGLGALLGALAMFRRVRKGSN